MIGLVYILHAELYLGNTCVIVPAFDFPKFLSYIQNYHMTKSFLVPPIVVRLVKDSLTQKYDLSSLEQVICGAAPLGSDTMALMRSKFKGIVVKQGILSYDFANIAYGMTETSPVVTAQLANDQVDGSSGVLVPNMKAKLVDPQSGKEITKYNIPGELWVSGPNVTWGYLRKEKETNETYTFDEQGRRWLHTGDEVEVRLSEKGQEHFWIVDRIKELIKVPSHKCFGSD
jgi:acyl-CoA synthetase (AMP-forming)/AMP-acid ligase II